MRQLPHSIEVDILDNYTGAILTSRRSRWTASVQILKHRIQLTSLDLKVTHDEASEGIQRTVEELDGGIA
ncbi:hypothetical protein LWI29_011435 [Acer saccharum]|uniref:Uncharacterized protein n=1 Tax=Acer saccharum TaxID=4024 RepID=A0AA39VIV2_ACESA|nr:hypothetical protein LWI29_011435 [Acer saccharum]